MIDGVKIKKLKVKPDEFLVAPFKNDIPYDWSKKGG